MSLLLDRGCDTTARSNDGLTAVEHCKRFNQSNKVSNYFKLLKEAEDRRLDLVEAFLMSFLAPSEGDALVPSTTPADIFGPLPVCIQEPAILESIIDYFVPQL